MNDDQRKTLVDVIEYMALARGSSYSDEKIMRICIQKIKAAIDEQPATPQVIWETYEGRFISRIHSYPYPKVPKTTDCDLLTLPILFDSKGIRPHDGDWL